MLSVALSVRFLLELALLAVAAWTGFRFLTWPMGLVSGALTSIAVAMFWGSFLSPKRRLEIGRPSRLLVEGALFAVAAWLLFSSGYRQLAGVLLIIELVDKTAIEWLERNRQAD